MDHWGRPRAGLMALGLAAYWPQFAGMREGVLGHFASLAQKFAGHAALVDAGLVDSIEGARAAAHQFAAADVDVVFCHLTTYATSEPLVIALRELDVPVVLLNVQSVERLDMGTVKSIPDWLGVAISCAALPEMTASLIRLGKRFDIVTGFLNGDAVVDDAIAGWCRAAGLRRIVREKSFGLLGRPYPGMTDLYLDETAFFSRFSAYTRHLTWDEVAEASSAVDPDHRARRRADLEQAFEIPGGIPSATLDGVADVLAGFDRLVATQNLCALPNHYEGPVREDHAPILAASNPAFSILMREGIACPVEADIKVALAMLMLKQVAGTATLAELYSMDFRDDVLILGHSGAADIGISATKPVLRSSAVFHGKTGSGFLTQTFPGEGPMTLLSLAQRQDGSFAMVAAEGTFVAGEPMRLGDTNARVRFAPGLRGFVNAWSLQGPTHHGVMAPGRHLAALEKVAKLFGVELTVVCR